MMGKTEGKKCKNGIEQRESRGEIVFAGVNLVDCKGIKIALGTL